MAKFLVVSTASWLLIAALTNIMGNTMPILFQFQQYFLSCALFGLGLGFFHEKRANTANIALTFALDSSSSWVLWLNVVTIMLLVITFANCPGGLANAISAALQDTSPLAFVPEFIKIGLYVDILTMGLIGILLFAWVQIFVGAGRDLKRLHGAGSNQPSLVAFAGGSALAWAIYAVLALISVAPIIMLVLGCLGYSSVSANRKICAGCSAFAVGCCLYISSSGLTGSLAWQNTLPYTGPYNGMVSRFWANGSRVDTGPLLKEKQLLGVSVWLDRLPFQTLPVPNLSPDDTRNLQKQCGLPEFAISYLELPYRAMPKMTGKDALILGAGLGAEVSQCLSHGPSHITAVESQGWLTELARHQSFGPYSNAAVTLILDDPRQFLRRTKDKYDLIIFTGHSAVNRPNPFVILNHDDFLFTVQSFADAFALLKPEGQLLVISPAFDELKRLRLATNLLAIARRIDMALTTPYANYLILGKAAIESGPTSGIVESLRHEFGARTINHMAGLTGRAGQLTPTSDDTPFMVEVGPFIPLADAFLIIATMFVMLYCLRVNVPEMMLQNITGRKSRLFLLAVTFMVLMCKTCMIMSFEFGNTPKVIYLSIVCGWMMLLIACAFSYRLTSFPIKNVHVPMWVLWIAFLLVLVHDYYFNFDAACFFSNTLVRYGATVFMPWLPAFLAATLLSREIIQGQAQQECLGLSLIGFSLGCLVTIEVLFNGIASLDILAAGLSISVLLLTLLPLRATSGTGAKIQDPPGNL